MVPIVNCCNLLRAAIIIFFQTQCRSMMAGRGEWPMGLELAWHRYLLTSATGAATVSQQQCRNSTQWEGQSFSLFLNKKKKLWKTSGDKHKRLLSHLPCWVQDLDTFFTDIKKEGRFVCLFGYFYFPGPTAPSPLLQSKWPLISL